jgi:hypothetical protein
MAQTKTRTDARDQTLRVLRSGGDAEEIRRNLATDQLQGRRHREPFLDALLDLLVEVYALTAVSRDHPIQMEGLVETYLAGYEFRGKVDHRNLHYALTYPALIHGGLEPDLGNDLYSWRSELWPYVPYAIEAYLRIAAERTGMSAVELAARLPN